MRAPSASEFVHQFSVLIPNHWTDKLITVQEVGSVGIEVGSQAAQEAGAVGEV